MVKIGAHLGKLSQK